METIREHKKILERSGKALRAVSVAEPVIQCPACGTSIPLNEAISARLREETETTVREEYKERLRIAVQRVRAKSHEEYERAVADLSGQVAELRRIAAEQYLLKLKEKDSQIDDLKNLLEQARRKSEQGSQERQGEVLELDLEEVLERTFPPGCDSAGAEGNPRRRFDRGSA